MKLPRWLRRWAQQPPQQQPAPVSLPTQWGPVTEAARYQAAINIRMRPDIRERVLQVIQQELGEGSSREDAERELLRRYPEANNEIS